jgi:NagD protein
MKPYKNYLMDMDGVLVRGRSVVPGAQPFIDALNAHELAYLVLTNNPLYTPGDLAHRLQTMGLEVPEDRIFTSAIATARFMRSQQPEGKAFVIGESGLTEAVHAAGYIITDHQPDYVVLGETHGYNLRQITKAIRLIMGGARFIATNPDPSGPGEGGIEPACGAMAALIEKATGISPFFVGKPNPLMMRSALNYLHAHSEETVMIGDRMDTDIVGAVSSGLDTVLVLTGVTQREQIAKYPYQPTYVLESIGDIDLDDPHAEKAERKPSKTREREAAISKETASKDGKQ